MRYSLANGQWETEMVLDGFANRVPEYCDGFVPKSVHPIIPTPAEPNWYYCTRWQRVVVVIHVTLAG